MEDFFPRYPLNERAGAGRLQIRATTASEALPVQGAVVYVTTQGASPTLLHQTRTDENGLTPVLALDAPPAAESAAPGGVPFTEYVVFVQDPRFRPMRFLGVPVFDGVTTVQPAALQPMGRQLGVLEVPPYTTQL